MHVVWVSEWSQTQSCLLQNLPRREKLAMSTDNFRGMPTCLICTEKLAVQKEYNVRRHYSTKHAEEYAKYKGDEREDPVAKLKTSKKMSTEATRSFQESMLMSTIITPEAALAANCNTRFFFNLMNLGLQYLP